MVYVLDYSTNCGSKWSLKQTSGYSQTPSVQNKEHGVLGYSTVEANGV